jgi:hypothetical protein
MHKNLIHNSQSSVGFGRGKGGSDWAACKKSECFFSITKGETFAAATLLRNYTGTADRCTPEWKTGTLHQTPGWIDWGSPGSATSCLQPPNILHVSLLFMQCTALRDSSVLVPCRPAHPSNPWLTCALWISPIIVVGSDRGCFRSAQTS